MKNNKEIHLDYYCYILSAVSSDMYNMVRYEYFDFMDGQAGHASFYEEMETLLEEIMFGRNDTPFLTWANQWDAGNGFDFPFMYGTCLDWYHMKKVRELFIERHYRWRSKENGEDEIINLTAYLMSISDDPDALVNRAQNRLHVIKFEERVNPIINQLKEENLDGESMQYILESIGMDLQMYKQLDNKFNGN